MEADDAMMAFTGHTDSVYAVAAHPALPVAVSASGDETLHSFGVLDGQTRFHSDSRHHSESIVCVQFSRHQPKGTAAMCLLASADMAGVLCIWDASGPALQLKSKLDDGPGSA